MTTSASDPAAPAAAVEPKPKPFARMIGVVFSPVETLRDIAHRPDVLVPLIVVMVITSLSAFVNSPHIDYAAPLREAAAKQDREPPAGAIKWAEASGRMAPYISAPISAVFFALLAGVLLLAFRAFGGEGTFKQAYSLSLYAWVPMLLYGIVVGVVLLAQGGKVSPQDLPTVVLSNPGFFVDRADHPLLFALLTSVDVFALWTLALLAVGFMFLSGLSRAASIALTSSLYGVVILFKMGNAALSTMMGPK